MEGKIVSLEGKTTEVWNTIKRNGALFLGGAMLLSLSCTKEPTHPKEIEPLVWEVLSAQSIPENSLPGKIVYPNITDKVHYSQQITYSVLPNANFSLKIDGKSLVLNSIQEDWNGADTVRVLANEEVGKFLLTVTPVDNPASWVSLSPDKSVFRNSPDGTIIYGNIEARLVTDPEIPKTIQVTSANSHFQAYYQRPDICIRNLDGIWTGEETVTVDGNGIPASFQLNVLRDPNEPILHLDATLETGSLIDNTLMNDHLIIGVTRYLNGSSNIFAWDVNEFSNIATAQNPFKDFLIADSGTYIYLFKNAFSFDTNQDNDPHAAYIYDSSTFAFVKQTDAFPPIYGLAANSNNLYVIEENELLVLDPLAVTIRARHAIPTTGQFQTVIATDQHLILPEWNEELPRDMRFTVYDAETITPAFTDTIRGIFPSDRKCLYYSNGYLMARSDTRTKLYDETFALKRTDDWGAAITLLELGSEHMFLRIEYENDAIYTFPAMQKITEYNDPITAVGFHGNYFFGAEYTRVKIFSIRQ
jgi:hypothetical protein